MPRLVVEKGKDKGKVLQLKENAPFLVGRDLKTHLRLRDQQVSRRHLKITYKLGEVRLEDLDSSNGTFVNGERIRSALLNPGDKIQTGETLIFYLEDESQDGEGPTASGRLVEPKLERARKGELTDTELAGYRIGRLLGRGGMGTVYEALQISLERRVAFKVLAAELAADSQFVDRFTAEARAAGQLNHPNIVQVYDVGVSNTGPQPVRFYSMEFMAGGSVEDLLRRDGRLSVERALPIVFDAARGLEYAERHGVVHRDIKPDNLMISEDGVVKIGDLGIATRRRTEDEAQKEDGVSGSPHYMAPEQALGRAIDHRADLYALGVSLYQMLSGETPYEGSSAREVILKHLNEPPPPLAVKVPALAPEVVVLVERLMEKDPTKRLASASILLQELVPLVRRFPIGETSRLRIDGIIAQRTELQAAIDPGERRPLPDTEPRASQLLAKAETAVLPTTEVPKRLPVAKAALVRLVFVLGSLALGVLAFGVVSKIQQRAEIRRADRAQKLQEVRDLLDLDPVTCEKEAKKLAVDFEHAGFHAEAAQAAEVAAKAGEKLADLEEKKRAQDAAAAYKAAIDKVGAAKGAAGDPDEVAYYALAVSTFGEVAEKFSGTAEGDRASRDRELARSKLEKAKEQAGLRQSREDKARRDLMRTQEALKVAYAEHRFEDANAFIGNFARDHGETELGAKAIEDLKKELLRQGGLALDEVRKRVQDAVSKKRWEEGRIALRDLLDRVRGVKPLEDAIQSELKSLEALAAGDRNAEQEQRDKERHEAALVQAKPLIESRLYDDAAAALEDGSAKIRSTRLQRELDLRARRLRGASAALKDLVAAIQERRRGVNVTHEGLVAEEFAAGKIRFKDKSGRTLEVAIAQAPADELHRWVQQSLGSRPQAAGLIHAASLALELGDKDAAGRDLDAALDALPSRVERDRIDELRDSMR